MKRLLLVTHRALPQEGGPTARWRAFVRYLPDHGWEVDVVSAPFFAYGSYRMALILSPAEAAAAEIPGNS